jgi:transcriptional regulator with XRE-family HTH domain
MALENLGEHIRTVRKERGLSQEALARRADVSLNLVGRLELGMVKNPHYGTLAGLARALDLTVEELVEEPEASTTGKASAASAGRPSQAQQVAQEAAERAQQLTEEVPTRMQEIAERMASGAVGQGVSSSASFAEASSEASAILAYALQAGMLTEDDLEEARDALRQRHASHE